MVRRPHRVLRWRVTRAVPGRWPGSAQDEETAVPSNDLLVVINSLGLLFAILNSFTLGLRFRVGRTLEHFFQNWQLAVRALLVNFVVLPALVIGFAAIVPVDADIKIGFCIVALA